MARGMSRRGLSVSSPSEAAPSKPRKREEPVDGSQGDGPESDSVRHREGGQGEFLSTRGRAAYYPGEDDYDKDQIDSAIASQKRGSAAGPARGSARLRSSSTTSYEDVLRQEGPHYPVRRVHDLQHSIGSRTPRAEQSFVASMGSSRRSLMLENDPDLPRCQRAPRRLMYDLSHGTPQRGRRRAWWMRTLSRERRKG